MTVFRVSIFWTERMKSYALLSDALGKTLGSDSGPDLWCWLRLVLCVVLDTSPPLPGLSFFIYKLLLVSQGGKESPESFMVSFRVP